MDVFKDKDDAINFAVRKIFWDVLHRRVDAAGVAQWAADWKANGGDHVLNGIMDSPEGHENEDAMRKALGLPLL